MRFRVTFEGMIVDDDGALMSPDSLDALLDQVSDELAKLPDGQDADTGGTLAKGLVEIAASIETVSGSEEAATKEALSKGGAIIRAALHAAQVATPGWSIEQLRVVIESEREEEDGRGDRGKHLMEA